MAICANTNEDLASHGLAERNDMVEFGPFQLTTAFVEFVALLPKELGLLAGC